MNLQQQLRNEGIPLRRFEHDDGIEFVADLGPGVDANVDVVDDTVIVVTDEDQYDLDVDGDAQAFMQHGVLTIEVNR